MSQKQIHCHDCDSVDRRAFLKASAAGVAAASAGLTFGSNLLAADKKQPQAETLVKQLYGTLSDEQKKVIVFPFDHELRSKVDNNWHITKSRVGNDFTKDQQQLIMDIFKGLHSEEFAETAVQQVDHDNSSKNLARCAIALFGQPGEKFEFVLSGRHVTRRCDGNSVEGAAFGGPIFYGHAAKGFNEAPDHPGNVYWYQAKRANELYQALDGKQQKLALLGDPRAEKETKTVELSGKTTDLAGLPFSELTDDQKELARKVMDDVLAPFREVDRVESLKLIESGSGFDNLRMSYYKNMDIGSDGVWDVWQIEGPNMIWHFRGSPHVHTWVHIRDKA